MVTAADSHGRRAPRPNIEVDQSSPDNPSLPSEPGESTLGHVVEQVLTSIHKNPDDVLERLFSLALTHNATAFGATPKTHRDMVLRSLRSEVDFTTVELELVKARDHASEALGERDGNWSPTAHVFAYECLWFLTNYCLEADLPAYAEPFVETLQERWRAEFGETRAAELLSQAARDSTSA
ncbi:MAG: hypothetical protein AAFQ65_00335 [Myxococcota bacterium]